MRGLILCAGLGERLRPLTATRAKPAIEFLNLPMLAYPYHWLSTLGLSEIVFNTHHCPESIRHAAMNTVDPLIAMHFTHEPAILGSGGGIWNARFHLQGEPNFAVANGDGVVLCPDDGFLLRMRAFHESKDALATLLVCPLPGIGERLSGAWMNEDDSGRIAGFGKESPRPGLSGLHYASYMLLSERLWKHLPEGGSNILHDVLVPRLRAGDGVYGFRVDDLRWFETGNAADYLAATRFCLESLRDDTAPGRCARNILDKRAHSRHNDFSRLRLIADSAEVEAPDESAGFLVVGEDAKVERGARLTDCVVLPGVHVPAGTTRANEIISS